MRGGVTREGMHFSQSKKHGYLILLTVREVTKVRRDKAIINIFPAVIVSGFCKICLRTKHLFIAPRNFVLNSCKSNVCWSDVSVLIPISHSYTTSLCYITL